MIGMEMNWKCSSLSLTMDDSTWALPIINSAEQVPMIGDDPWYLVSKRWFNDFAAAVTRGDDLTSYEDIDNLDLCDPSEGDSHAHQAKLRSPLKQDVDYKIVPKNTWDILYEKLGGGPEFPRQVIEIGGKPQLEVYPYTLRVTYLKRPQVVDSSNPMSSVPEMKAMVFEFSKKATIKDLRAIVYESFEIAPEDATYLSIFNYLDDTLGPALEDYVDERDPRKTTWKETSILSTIHSCRLVDNQALLIDQRKDIPSESADSNTVENALGELTISPANGQESSGQDTSSGLKVPELNLEMILSKPSKFPRGVCGLRNLGNTCFMNSALQCLASVEPLMQYYLLERHIPEINVKNPLGKQGELALEFGKLMKDMWSGSVPFIIPRDFKWMIGNLSNRFDDHSQQDAQELLAFLLDGLHEDVNRVLNKPITPPLDISNDSDQSLIAAAEKSWQYYKLRNDSIIVDLFQATTKSRLECPDCGKISITFEPFMYLSLPIPSDSIRTKEVLFSFQRGGLVKCAVSLPRNSSMSEVKSKLAALSGVSANRIFLADVYQNKIHKRFASANRLSEVSNSDNLVAFEVQYDISTPMLQKVTIPIVQRRPVVETDSTGKYVTNFVPYGLPNFIVVNKHTTYGNLLEQVKRQLIHQVDMQHVPNASQFPFTLSKIKANGQTLHRLNIWTHGSSLSAAEKFGTVAANHPTTIYNLHVSLNAGDTLGVDWDLSAFSRISPPPREIIEKVHPNFDETIAQGRILDSKPTTIDDCLKTYTKTEKLDTMNAWRCPECKTEKEASKTISIWTLPEILVIHLKRFSESYFSRQKLVNFISFPPTGLDLAPYIGQRPPDTIDPTIPTDTLYDLFAISNHYGGMGGGHYTAVVRNFVNGKWYEFDDHQAHELAEEKVVTPAAYVLFFHRRRNCGSSPSSTPKL